MFFRNAARQMRLNNMAPMCVIPMMHLCRIILILFDPSTICQYRYCSSPEWSLSPLVDSSSHAGAQEHLSHACCTVRVRCVDAYIQFCDDRLVEFAQCPLAGCVVISSGFVPASRSNTAVVQRNTLSSGGSNADESSVLAMQVPSSLQFGVSEPFNQKSGRALHVCAIRLSEDCWESSSG